MRLNLDEIEFDQLSLFNHFNIFKDLFLPGVYFRQTQQIQINYGEKKVLYGNDMLGEEVKMAPKVKIIAPNSSKKSGFNTLLMINLDGNFVSDENLETTSETLDENFASENKQVVQWLVTNIPDHKELTEGETIVEYLQPLAAFGVGYVRVAFILFRHSEKVDMEHLKLKAVKDLWVFKMINTQIYNINFLEAVITIDIFPQINFSRISRWI